MRATQLPNSPLYIPRVFSDPAIEMFFERYSLSPPERSQQLLALAASIQISQMVFKLCRIPLHPHLIQSCIHPQQSNNLPTKKVMEKHEFAKLYFLFTT